MYSVCEARGGRLKSAEAVRDRLLHQPQNKSEHSTGVGGAALRGAPVGALLELQLAAVVATTIATTTASSTSSATTASSQQVAHLLVVDLEVRRAHEELARAALLVWADVEW